MVVAVGANLPAVGGHNQRVVLDAIRRAPGGISRVELAERTGLSAQTVTNVSRRLLGLGLVHEAGTRISGVGKPRTILQLSPHGRFALGVHVDPSVAIIVLLDLSGAIVDHRTVDIDASSPPEDTLALIAGRAGAVLDAAGDARERMIGVGVAAPGPIAGGTGTIINPPLMPGWERIPVRDRLSELLGLPVLLEKDVTAAAVAEQWMGAGSRENFAFLYYGTGVGVGIVLQNEVIRAASGNVGDIGGLAVGLGAYGADERARPFGDAVSPTSIVAHAVARGVLPEPPARRAAGFHLLDEFVLLNERADRGEAGARAVIETVVDDLARTLVPLANLLDVDRFVFGGPFWPPISRRMLAELPDRFAASPHLVGVHPVAFEQTAVGSDVTAVGAACLVLDHELSPRPVGLLIAHQG